MYDGVEIPEPVTFNDEYATQGDAAREATLRIDRDLTRNDLKLTPPVDLRGPQLNQWKSGKTTELEVEIGGEKKQLTDEALQPAQSVGTLRSENRPARAEENWSGHCQRGSRPAVES